MYLCLNNLIGLWVKFLYKSELVLFWMERYVMPCQLGHCDTRSAGHFLRGKINQACLELMLSGLSNDWFCGNKSQFHRRYEPGVSSLQPQPLANQSSQSISPKIHFDVHHCLQHFILTSTALCAIKASYKWFIIS